MKYIHIPFILLFILPSLVTAAEEKAPESDEQQLKDKFAAAEEKHKDNPYMLKFIQQLKGILPEESEEEKPAPAEPAFKGSGSTADSAYKKGDYETAFKHYKALAEEGDAEAAMMLGVMYQGGLGTEKNDAAAHAWYKKSSEEGVSGSGALLERVEEDDMSSEELQEAENYYAEITGQTTGDKETGKQAVEQSPALLSQGEVRPVATLPPVVKPSRDFPRDIQYTDYTRQVRITPEKIRSMQHPSPEATRHEHIQPERFYRQRPAG